MQAEVVQKDTMTLIGAVSYGGSICDLWNRFTAEEAKVENKIDGAWYEYQVYPQAGQTGEPCYFAGVEVTDLGSMPDDMFAKILPAGEWAVFTHCLSDGGYDVLNKNIRDWLNREPYQQVDTCSLQIYDTRYKGHDNPESILQLLIRVQPK